MKVTASIFAVLSFLTLGVAQDPDLKELSSKIEKGTETSRLKAIEQAGQLGEKGKPLLRTLSTGMLAKEQKVRVASAAAMKLIDDNVADLAVKLILNFDKVDFEVIQKQGASVVEPLVPLLINRFDFLLNQPRPSDAILSKSQLILNCLYTNAPNDDDVNKLILRVLKSPLKHLQHTGVIGARLIKDGRKGMDDIIRIAKICPDEGIRLEAIKSVIELTDDDNRKTVTKSLSEIRFDNSETIRKAVDNALDKIKSK